MNPFFESFQKELGVWLARILWIILLGLLATAGFVLPQNVELAKRILLGLVSLAIVVSAIFLLIRRFSYQSSESPTSSTSDPVTQQKIMTATNTNPLSDIEGYSKRPTAREIQIEIDSTPPFQQETKASSYSGLKVHWITNFAHCSHDGNRKISIAMTDLYGVPYVYFDELDIERYPQFKIAHAESKIIFIGTISKIAPKGIIVVPDMIFFPDSK